MLKLELNYRVYFSTGLTKMKSTVILVVSIIVAVGVVALAFVNRPEPEVDLPLVIEEYSDPNCPHCKNFQPTMNQLKDEYADNDDVEFEFVTHPILGSSSEQAAFAIEAADRQGKEEEYVNLIYENFESRADEDYVSFAEQLELDIEQFNKDREDSELQREVLDRLETNRNAGITSTPTLLINGKKESVRDFDSLVERIEELLELGRKQQAE